MSTTPPGYGRTQMLSEVSHDLAQRLLSEVHMLQLAFSQLPGAADVDLDKIAAAALAAFSESNPPSRLEAGKADVAAAVARMRRQPG